MAKAKVVNGQFTNESPDEFKQRLKLGVDSGEGNTFNPNLRVPTWERSVNEKWITQKHCNAYITIGHDRPAHPFTGYGGSAGTECSTIDICVGSASSLRTPGKGGKKSFGKDQVVGKLFSSDASRIYISQQTDIDKNFGIPQGKAPESNGHAAIGIKSDHVRIIGRSSIKIYAGRGIFDGLGFTGEKNARGATNKHASTIEFITGVGNMQPVVKGENLLKCIANLYDHIARINQALLLYDKGLLTLRGSAILNFHPSTPVVTFPDPINVITQLINMVGEISTVVNNASCSSNVEIDKQNFLGVSTEHGDGSGSFKTDTYILSESVFTS